MATELERTTATTKASADPMLPRVYRTVSVRREMPDTYTLIIEPSSEEETLSRPFAPGQFNMLYVFGVGEVPISVSGDPARTEKLTHTIRSVGAVSDALCKLRRGDALGVRGPFGNGWPMREAEGRDLVIVAGGLGLAPLRPVIYALLARRESYGRVTLLCGAREPEGLLYRRELEGLRARFDLDVRATVDVATSDWRGNVGVVTTLIKGAGFDPERAVAFVCGPEVMMRFSARELLARGVGEERIYLSMERNMKCAVGFCGRCQFGPSFICKDGPVIRYDRLSHWLAVREI